MHPALVDIGINLTHGSFDGDREAVIERAARVGVAPLVVTGASMEGSAAAAQLARTFPGRLFATAGVHPHHARALCAQDEDAYRRVLGQAEVVAAGECGLDYYRNLSPREDQCRAFAWQLQWSAASNKPLFLHQRDAHQDFMAILREHRRCPIQGVAHCFTGGERELEDCLEAGLHIGITGWICDERRGLHLRELVARIPRGRLLLETDGPYLLPRDLQPVPPSRRNEPAFLPHIAARVAQCRGESLQECAAHTTAAARALFALPAQVHS